MARSKWLQAASLAAMGWGLTATGVNAQTTDGEQAPPAEALAEEETPSSGREIIVTGSRIKGVAPVGSAIKSYSADDLLKQPSSNVVDALNRDPIFSGIGNNEAVKNSVGPGVTGINGSRSSEINLRGIGPKATLVLFDGMRGPPTGATGRNRDSSTIPSLAIQRVDVVADGASAIYGSDAIAGVINFIPRRSYEGLQVRGRYSFADGYQAIQAGMMVGHEWDGGGAVFSYEYRHNTRLNGLERDWYRSDLRAQGGTDYRSNQCNPGTIVVGGQTYAIPAGGITPATAAQLVAGTQNLCEISNRSDLLPINTTHIGYASITQDLTDNITLHVKGVYSRRDYEVKETVVGSRQAQFTVTVPRSNAYFVAPPGTNPTSVDVRILLDQNGLFTSRGFQDWKQAIVGLDADFGRWNVTANYTIGGSDSQLVARGVLSSALTSALASSNPATAFNPFGGSNSQAVLDSVFLDNYDPGGRHTIQQASFQANGPLFSLPGGDLRVAAGAEYYWLQDYNYNHLGDIRIRRLSAAKLRRDVLSQYAEIYVPLFGEGNATTLLHKLDLSAAVRRDEYSDVGETVNPKFGINWFPVEGLMLRGSYGTSFNAPVQASTTTPAVGASLIYATYTDPLSSTGRSSGIVINDGNPGLKPESSTSWSLGAELKPVAMPGLSFSATFFSIDFRDQINTIDRPTALINPTSAPFVTRNPTAAQVDAVLASGLPTSGVRPPAIAFIIDGRSLNLGGLKLQGVDFRGEYAWSMGAGRMRAGFDATLNTKFDVETVKGAGYLDQLNTIYNPVQFRGRATVGGQFGAASADLFFNYVNGYANTLSTPVSQIRSYSTVDLRLGYDLALFGSNPLSLSVEVNNLFDRDPNFANIDGGVDLTTASPLGRTVALTLTKKF